MVDIKLKQFTAPPRANSQTLGRNVKTNNVEFTAGGDTNLKYIADAQFNNKDGVLSLIKKDASIIEVSGFLTQDQLGHGERGKRGERGKDGKDADNGKDGKDGDEGCEGDKGARGKVGAQGTDGEGGPVGIDGKTGCEGITGEEGDVGEGGDKGFKGEKGRKGISCISGKVGPQGSKPKSYAWVGKDEPDDSYVVWAVEYVGEVPEVIDPNEIIIVANSVDQPMLQFTDNQFTTTATIDITDIINIVGNAKLSWSGDYTNDPNLEYVISGNKKHLTLTATKTIPRESASVISGSVVIDLEDFHDGKTAQKIVTYNFYATNKTAVAQDITGIAVNANANEGNEATFRLNLSEASTNDIVVNLAFGGKLTRLSSSKSISKIITAGETFIEFKVGTLVKEGFQENDVIEGIFTSSDIREVSLGDMTSKVTLTEETILATVKIADKSFLSAMANPLRIPINLDGVLNGTNATVDYEVVDVNTSTQEYGIDYSFVKGKTNSVTFTSDYGIQYIDFNLLSNGVSASDEIYTFHVNLTGGSNNITLPTNKTIVITITVLGEDTWTGGGGGSGGSEQIGQQREQ